MLNFLQKEGKMKTLKRYSIKLKSISPFCMNCDTLANPLNPVTKQLKQLTSLKTKQDEHHLAIAKLQWTASLYYNDEIGIYVSSKMLGGCIRASARKEKKGLLTKAIIIDAIPGVPLIGFEGVTPEKLWNVKNKKGEQIHVFTESVNVQKSKTMRTRPIFPSWEAKFEVLLNTELMSEDEFRRILDRAGYEYGIGELRPQLATGVFGRFEVVEMDEI
jgi:hypothetical protein